MQFARQALALLQHGQRPLLFHDPRLGALLLGHIVQQEEMANFQSMPISQGRGFQLIIAGFSLLPHRSGELPEA